MAVLTPEDLKAIEAKIAEVESHTAGEIVVHVVNQSDGYGVHRLGCAFIFAAIIAEVLTYRTAALNDLAVEITAGGTLALWFLFGVPAILRYFVPPAVKKLRVHRRALQAFVENGVHRTRDASGVLILVSLFEHRVEILADAGIHARVGVAGWKKYVGCIVDGMKTGRPAAGIIETIGLIGQELRSDVPIKPDDENELSNEVVISKR